MKRFLSPFLIVSLILFLYSCHQNPEITDKSVVYYYCKTEIEFGSNDGIIAHEIRDATGHINDYHYLVEQYLCGPVDKDLISPFPAGITLEELNVDSSKVQIMLSHHLSLLSGSELMTACACLAKTIAGMTGLQTIQISSENGLLNNMEIITITADSFVYSDDSAHFIMQ